MAEAPLIMLSAANEASPLDVDDFHHSLLDHGVLGLVLKQDDRCMRSYAQTSLCCQCFHQSCQPDSRRAE